MKTLRSSPRALRTPPKAGGTRKGPIFRDAAGAISVYVSLLEASVGNMVTTNLNWSSIWGHAKLSSSRGEALARIIEQAKKDLSFTEFMGFAQVALSQTRSYVSSYQQGSIKEGEVQRLWALVHQ